MKMPRRRPVLHDVGRLEQELQEGRQLADVERLVLQVVEEEVDVAAQRLRPPAWAAVLDEAAEDDLALVEPLDIVLEPDGNLLFCDARDARVRRLWLKWGF